MSNSLMKSVVVYIHGKGGNACEADHYRGMFPECEVIGFDYNAETPWDAKEEFPLFFASLAKKYSSIILIANSIGAFFSMCALSGIKIEHAYFISPIVDMEKLIQDMMGWAGVTENELMERGEVATSFGETLSWDYLSYVRGNPIDWYTPTDILFGENDHLILQETMRAFALRIGASLTVMKGGEHWFHTEQQMNFLDRWITHRRTQTGKTV